MLKEDVRVWGLEPEKTLTKEALAKPHRAYATVQDREEDQIKILSRSLKELIKRELA